MLLLTVMGGASRRAVLVEYLPLVRGGLHLLRLRFRVPYLFAVVLVRRVRVPVMLVFVLGAVTASVVFAPGAR